MSRAFRLPAASHLARFCFAAVALSIGSAAAQEWPTRTIRAIVPLTAGSAVDIVPRIVFEQVAAQIGQTIVVDNRTGASGTIGTRAAATAPPDGYTLLAHSSALVISPFTVANAHYDPVKDFVPVAPLGNLPNRAGDRARQEHPYGPGTRRHRPQAADHLRRGRGRHADLPHHREVPPRREIPGRGRFPSAARPRSSPK